MTVLLRTMQYSVVQCITVQFSTMQWSPVQNSTGQCSAIQLHYNVVHYNIVQYITVQYITVQCCLIVQYSAWKCRGPSEEACKVKGEYKNISNPALHCAARHCTLQNYTALLCNAMTCNALEFIVLRCTELYCTQKFPTQQIKLSVQFYHFLRGYIAPCRMLNLNHCLLLRPSLRALHCTLVRLDHHQFQIAILHMQEELPPIGNKTTCKQS